MLLPKSIPWMPQNTSASSLGCILDLIFVCVLLLLDLWFLGLTLSWVQLEVGSAEHICLSHSQVSGIFCGNFSCLGERERNSAWTGQALLIPAQSVVQGPWLQAAAQNCWSNPLWPGAPNSPLQGWELALQFDDHRICFPWAVSGCLKC